MGEKEALLTPQEAANRLRISISTLWRLVNDGKIREIRISDRVIRFRTKDLLPFEEEEER